MKRSAVIDRLSTSSVVQPVNLRKRSTTANSNSNSNASTSSSNCRDQSHYAVYTNAACGRSFIYPRALQARSPFIGNHEKNQHSEQLVSGSSNEQTSASEYNAHQQAPDVIVVGVPDSVSPLCPETLLKREPNSMVSRVYYFSNRPLTPMELRHMDSVYAGTVYTEYPVLAVHSLLSHRAVKLHSLMWAEHPNVKLEFELAQQGCVPLHNFYLALYNPRIITDNNSTEINMINTFVEYRYLARRHLAANRLWDPNTEKTCALCLPENHATLVLIMPHNFVRVTRKSGFFYWPEALVVVWLFSQVPLSSAFQLEQGKNTYTTPARPRNKSFMRALNSLFSRLGLHQIWRPSDKQIVAYDSLITLVVGALDNLELPKESSEIIEATAF